MKIAVDLDEVVSETLPAFLDYYAELTGRRFRVDQFYCYHWHDVIGVPAPELSKALEKFYSSDAYWSVPPVISAREHLPELSNLHELCIVTSRWGSARDRTLDWVEQHFRGIFSSVHFSRNHYLPDQFSAPEEKWEICHRIGATVLIDDSLEYVRLCLGNSVTPILFDRPWNQTNEELLRAKDWKEIGALLTQLGDVIEQ